MIIVVDQMESVDSQDFKWYNAPHFTTVTMLRMISLLSFEGKPRHVKHFTQ